MEIIIKIFNNKIKKNKVINNNNNYAQKIKNAP